MWILISNLAKFLCDIRYKLRGLQNAFQGNPSPRITLFIPHVRKTYALTRRTLFVQNATAKIRLKSTSLINDARIIFTNRLPNKKHLKISTLSNNSEFSSTYVAQIYVNKSHEHTKAF